MDSKDRKRVEELVKSLFIAIKERNCKRVQFLLRSHQVDVVNATGNIQLNNQNISAIPALFAAVLSGHIGILKSITNEYSNTKCKIKIKRDNEEHIDILEVVGLALIAHGKTGMYKSGLEFWKEAFQIRLRLNGNSSATLVHQNDFEEKVFKAKRKFATIEELNALLEVNIDDEELKYQLFFTIERILKKYNCFPNMFAIHSLYNIVIADPKKLRVDPLFTFVNSVYMLKLLSSITLDESTETICFKMINTTLSRIFTVLRNQSWVKQHLNDPESVVSFENLKVCLAFCCVYQQKLDCWTVNATKKKEEFTQVTNGIIIVLRLLVKKQKSSIEKDELKTCLTDAHREINKCASPETDILMNVCLQFKAVNVTDNDFKLIRLLLETGANPNAMDLQGKTALHHLAEKESKQSARWPFCVSESYVKRFCQFTKTVKFFF